MLERRHGTVNVECVALIGHGQIEDASRSQDAASVHESPQRVLGVLEEVVRDDEIEARVGDRGKALAVIDDVDLN